MKPGILPLRHIALVLTLLVGLRAGAELLQPVSVVGLALEPPAGGGGDSGSPILSADGRYVLFASSANNLALIGTNVVPGRFPAPLNVFLRDRMTQTTRIVSVNATGTEGGNGDSLPLAISTNGQFALFESSASNLVVDDTNNVTDIFLRDLVNDTTRIVSVRADGGSANGHSYSAVMTPDARHVAFVSAASDLVPDDTNGIPDVFVRDLQNGAITLASVGGMPDAGNSLKPMSGSPEITPDGRFVAFYSTATNLIPGAADRGGVYVRDLVAGETFWASTNAQAVMQSVFGVSVATNTIAYNHRISADGNFVAYQASPASGTLAETEMGCILRYHRDTGLSDLVFTNAVVTVTARSFEDARKLDMTPDGQFIAFVAKSNVPPGTATCIRVWDAQTGSSTLASGDLNGAVPAGSVSDWPTFDATGRYVAFVSSAANLTTNSLVGGFQLYLHDRQTGTTILVNTDTNGMSSAVDAAQSPGLSADGRVLAFGFPDGTLVPNDHNRSYDVAARDLSANAAELISARQPTLPSITPLGHSTLYDSSVSLDGRYIAFVSDADDSVAGGPNGYRNVFLRDLLAGMTKLVSVTTDGTAEANGHSLESSISADGRYVAFSSRATNLAAGDTNNAQDVFVRDLFLETNTLVSTRPDAPVSGNGASYAPVISTNGQFVLFRSQASDLALPSINGERLFWRDLSSSTNRRVSDSAVVASAMTPDGRFVAYGVSGFPARIVVWDSQSATPTYTNSAGGDLPFAISPDGRWLVFSANNILQAVDVVVRTNFTLTATNIRAPLRFSGDSRFLTYAHPGGQVYLFDFQSASNRLVTRAFGSAAGASGRSDSPAISADGRFVAYRSIASDIVPGDDNGVPDIFLYDRLADSTTLVSVNRSGSAAANNRSLKPSFSGDGRTLVFQSAASDLIPGDFNQSSDVFALRLASATITDTDDDQMDDDWELFHFKTLARDGTDDFDHDGASDWFEFHTGTNPTDATSLFRGQIVFMASPGELPVILWPATPGRAYRVQFKNALDDPEWMELNNGVSIFGGAGYASDPSPDASQRVYRIGLTDGLTP